MQCIFCPQVIDETSDHTNRGGILIPTRAELESWNQLQVSTFMGGQLVLFPGHSCPAHDLKKDSLSLSFKYEPPPEPEAPVEPAPEVVTPPAPDVPASDDVKVRSR